MHMTFRTFVFFNCILIHVESYREGNQGKRVKTRIWQMHLGESATLLRQRENESGKCARDIISMKRDQVGANTQKKIQILRQRFTNKSGPSGPSGESANSESEMV